MQENGEQVKPKKREAIVALVVLVVVVALAYAGYQWISNAQPQDAQAAASQYAISSSGTSNAQPSASDSAALACEIATIEGDYTTLGVVSAGKPVVVNMWATWCPYCVDEMPDFQVLYEKYGEKVQFVMLNACDSSHEVAAAREYIGQNDFTFPVYFDAEYQVNKLLDVVGYPTTAIISPTGEILLNRPGRIDFDSMDATLASLVG